MTSQKLTHRQPFSAGLLQFANRQGAAAAGDNDAVAVDAQNQPFFTRTLYRLGTPQLDGLSAKLRLGAGKRVESANVTIQFLRILRPVDAALPSSRSCAA